MCLGLLIALGLLACVLPLGAQGQYDVARDAMNPAAVDVRSPANRLAAPDFARVPPAKARVRQLAAAAPAPSPDLPATAQAPVTNGQPDPGTPPADQPATGQPTTPPANPDQVQLSGERFSYRDDITTVEGKVELRYQDLTIRGDKGDLDKDRIWGAFHGPVTLESKLYKATGEDLRVNLDTEDWSVRKAAVEVTPEFFNDFLNDSLYLHAGEVVGRPKLVTGTQGYGTSCDHWPDPHWVMQSNTILYRPDDKVVFRRPTIYLFGRRLVRYPWDLRLSLTRKENRWLPEVGQNEVEGYYAKFSYGYELDDENSGFLRLHLTEKRGVGFGFDHTLLAEKQQGQFSVFFEPSEGSFSGRLDHRAQITRPFSTNVNLSFQDDTGYGIASESFSGNLALRYDTADSQSLLGVQQSIMSSSYSTSRRFSTSLDHRERLGADGEWTVRTSYSSSRYGSVDAADEELQTELGWRQQFRAFDLELQAEKRFDLDGSRYTGDDTYYDLARTPDVALSSESARLGNFRILGSEFNATVYLGRFEQNPEDQTIYRTGLDLRLPGHVEQLGGRASLRTSGRFQQMFYDDGSAQWIGQVQSEYWRKLSGSWESRLNFGYMRPDGYSPLRLDYASPSCMAYWQAVRVVPDRMRLDLTFGRDFQNDYYQDALFRGEYLLSSRNRIELQTGYSVELSRWRPANLRWIYATRRTWWSAFTFNYDLDQSDLTNVSMDVDWSPSDKWRVQFLGGYSSYGGFDQADFRIMRDLHCMMASLTWITSTNEIRFGLGIKAFPGDTRTFGVATGGRQFESNFSDQY